MISPDLARSLPEGRLFHVGPDGVTAVVLAPSPAHTILRVREGQIEIRCQKDLTALPEPDELPPGTRRPRRPAGTGPERILWLVPESLFMTEAEAAGSGGLRLRDQQVPLGSAVP